MKILANDRTSSGAGKVFIVSLVSINCLLYVDCDALLQGHSTAQTTGLGGHISARFIPTVERESIDFMYAVPLSL